MPETDPSNSGTQPARQTAVLISHGQPSDPAMAEAELADLRDSVARLLPGWKLFSATLAAPGAVEDVVAQAGDAPLIYPAFMTDGWFVRTVVPDRVGNPAAHLLPPLGVDPDLPALASTWLASELAAQRWAAHDTCLIVAGHGSGRSRNSARDTTAFAGAVQELLPFSDLRLGFVEEAPNLKEVAADVGPQAVCLPFFAARRGHVLDDIPEALNLAGFGGLRLNPIGLHPDIPALIARRLGAAGSG